MSGNITLAWADALEEERNEWLKAGGSGKLKRGFGCKACGKPVSGDPELCPTCLNVARMLIKDLDAPDAEDFIPYDEVMHRKMMSQIKDAFS